MQTAIVHKLLLKKEDILLWVIKNLLMSFSCLFPKQLAIGSYGGKFIEKMMLYELCTHAAHYCNIATSWEACLNCVAMTFNIVIIRTTDIIMCTWSQLSICCRSYLCSTTIHLKVALVLHCLTTFFRLSLWWWKKGMVTWTVQSGFSMPRFSWRVDW